MISMGACRLPTGRENDSSSNEMIVLCCMLFTTVHAMCMQ